MSRSTSRLPLDVSGSGPASTRWQSIPRRFAAAAANRLGIDCHLVLAGPEPETSSGNLLVDRLMGASLEFDVKSDYYVIEEAITAAAAQLASEGRRPYSITVGGASVTGVVAY